MLSEYSGPRILALWHEMRTLPLRANLYRLGYEFARKCGLHKRRYRAEPVTDADLLASLGGRFSGPKALFEHLRARRIPFFFDWRRREAYSRILNERFADDRARCLEIADQICRHRFHLMGQDAAFGDPIDWHRLLDAATSWPRLHWSAINYRCPHAPGDVKTTWELNRHQFWLHLGRAYWYTGDEKYPTEWARQLRSWIDQNPPEIGVNWLSNLEHALRVISWTWSLNFFLDSSSVTPDLVFEMCRVLLAKGRHLRRDIAYSLNVMPANHLLGDALGLVFLGFCFPEFTEAERWRDYGLRVLYGQLPRQVRADGSSIESSTGYHRFVLYFYILADLLHRANGGEPPPLVRDRVEKMIEVVQAVTKPDGTTSLFGDIDNAKAIFLSNEGPLDYRPTLATGAALFGRGDFKYNAGSLSQEVLWLLGPEGIERWDKAAAKPPASTTVCFPQGGVYTWRSGWDAHADYAMLKCGPFTGHAEADLGHLDLSVGGRNLLVDAGTFTYNGPWRWRTFFRGTLAHNTVSVGGKGQALAHRSFRFLFHPRDPGGEEQVSGDVRVIRVWHRSFRYLGSRGIRHERVLLVVRGAYWIVVDRLTGGRGERAFAQHWHFDPEAAVSLQRDTIIKAAPEGGEAVWFVPLERRGLEAELVTGRERPIQGWTSPGFGTKVPAPCVTYRWTDRLPTVQALVIVPQREAAGALPALGRSPVTDPNGRPIDDDRALGLTVGLADREHVLLLRFDAAARNRAMCVEGELFGQTDILKARQS